MAAYITLDEAKRHLRVDYDDDDVYIYGLADLVEELVLTEIQGKLITEEGTVQIRSTTGVYGTGTNFLDFTIGDIIVIQAQTPRVIINITSDILLNVDIAFSTYLSGLIYNIYTGMPVISGTIPLGLKQAMLLILGHFYNNRESTTFGVNVTEIPQGYKYLLAPYKNWTAG